MGAWDRVSQWRNRLPLREVAGSVLAKVSALRSSGSVADKLTALEAHQAGWLALPPKYLLEHGANVLLMCRRDGSVAATFSAKGTTPATVARTAEKDHKRNGRKRGHLTDATGALRGPPRGSEGQPAVGV
jgi:hypothetical protein